MRIPKTLREFFRCRVLRPLLRQLRGGVTPRRLAWSLSVGIIVGINPTVGLTTLVLIVLAWVFGLNQAASQVGSALVAPLHLLLLVPFLELGVWLFHTRRLPMDRHQLEHLAHHPIRLLREIWQWELHALLVWCILAAIALPLLAQSLRRALILLMRRNKALMRTTPRSPGAIGSPIHKVQQP